MYKLKFFILNVLYKFLNPYLMYLIIPIITRKNMYVDKKYISKELISILFKNIAYKSYKITATGVLMLFYKDKVIKIPLGEASKKSLQNNFINYKKLRKSSFSNLVEYTLNKKDSYYVMEKLFSCTIEDYEIDNILTQFKNQNKTVYIKELKEKLFSNISKIQKLVKHDILIPLELKVKVVLMHGDLTQNNIMKNIKGKIVLIDLDRFMFDGIEGIDKLHYEVDKESKNLKISFFEYIKQIKSTKKETRLLYIYLLYRVSSEYNDGIILKNDYYKDFSELMEQLK